VVTEDPFPGNKAAKTRSWPLTPSGVEIKNVWSYTSTPFHSRRGT